MSQQVRSFAIALVIALMAVACGSDDVALTATTVATTTTSTTDAGSGTATTATFEPPATTASSNVPSTTMPLAPTTTTRSGPLLAEARWVRVEIDALVDDRGIEVVSWGEAALAARSVERDPSGSIFYSSGAGVFEIAAGGTEPVRVIDGGVFDVRRTDSGEVLAGTSDGYVDVRTGEAVDHQPVGTHARIVAENGLAVEHLPGQFELDDEGWTRRVEKPEGIRLMGADGEQIAVWRLGGPSAAFVPLVDFDGRLVLAARGPEEPALPPWDYFLIDIEAGTVEAFNALPGSVALATSDVAEPPNVIDVPNIDLCPTWSPVVAQEASPDLPAAVATRYHEVMLAIARCDTWFTRRAGAPLEWGDASLWTALLRSMLGPAKSDGNGWVWAGDESVAVSIDSLGLVEIVVNEAARAALSILIGGGDMVLAGRLGPETSVASTSQVS